MTRYLETATGDQLNARVFTSAEMLIGDYVRCTDGWRPIERRGHDAEGLLLMLGPQREIHDKAPEPIKLTPVEAPRRSYDTVASAEEKAKVEPVADPSLVEALRASLAPSGKKKNR